MNSRTILALLVAGVLTGCSDDKSAQTIVEPPTRFSTPDQLLLEFQNSYNERNLGRFEHLLGEEFEFYFAVTDVDLSPGAQGFWDRAAELESATAMFGGIEGQKEDGSIQPSIRSITLQLTPADPEWRDASGDGVEFAGTLKRLYDADMTVEYTAGNIISSVQGSQMFYVAPVMVDGTEVYRLFAWRDLGNPLGKSMAGVEDDTWGSVKARF